MHARAVGRLRGRDEGVRVGCGDLVGLLVPGDAGEGDGAARLTWAAPAAVYGLVTDAMPGSAETRARAAVTAPRTGADSMLAPPVARMTTWSVSPEAAG